MYEKREAGLRLKQFITFIKKQTRKRVKRCGLDLGREFDVRDLKSQTKDKRIKIELTVTHTPKMIAIAELTTGLATSKVRCLLLDTARNTGQSFCLETVFKAVYFPNRSSLSFLKHDCPHPV